MLLFALVAATSPLALASVIAVLATNRARLNGTAFALGFVAGQSLFCVLAFAVGTLSVPDGDNHPTFRAILTILLGAALVVTAVIVRRDRDLPPRPRPTPRTDALRTRLSQLQPGSALGTGIALGIGGPKRLAITLVAVGTITTAGLATSAEVGIAVLYVLAATILVWGPVLLYLVFQERATRWLASGEAWVARHRAPLTFWPSAVVGVGLVVDGVIQLTA